VACQVFLVFVNLTMLIFHERTGHEKQECIFRVLIFLSKEEENFLTIVTLTRFLKIILNHGVNWACNGGVKKWLTGRKCKKYILARGKELHYDLSGVT
jgi:hypothetical protein